jgi:polysaccharide deacetylase family protein (PEP-CTERM system associated)
LAEEGFCVDSSIFPVRHDRYGIPDANPAPHYWQLPAGRLLEFPPSVMPVGRFRLPVAGGGYFRLLPSAVTHRAVRSCNRRALPFMFYVHPWELDPDQPVIKGVGLTSRARHRVNLRRTESKLRSLLSQFRFGTISEALKHAAPVDEGRSTCGGLSRQSAPPAVAESVLAAASS